MTTRIDGTTGNDTLTGTAGDDLILGHAGNDRLNGLAGDDTLDGGAGVNQIDAGEGNDTILIDGTAVSGSLRVPATGIDGGAGTDTISFAGAISNFHIVQIVGGSLQVTDLTTGARTIAVNVEHLLFTDTEVWLTPQANSAPVVSGPLTAFALEGEAAFGLSALAMASDADAGDVLSVTDLGPLPEGVSFDSLSQSLWIDPAAPGFDAMADGETTVIRIDYGITDGIATTAASAVLVVTGTNDAAVVGGDTVGAVTEDGVLTASGQLMVSDVDHGEAGLAAVSGLAGLYGSLSVDADGTWTYVLDNTALEVQRLTAGQVVSDVLTLHTLDGTAVEVSIAVTGVADSGLIVGTAAGERLTGTGAAETIFGLGGNDRINGRGGNDVLSGGEGADHFVFAGKFGQDLVTDFDTGVMGEVINLSAVSGLHGFADLAAHHLGEVDGNAVITVGGATLTLQGVSASSLTAADFLF